MCESNNVFNNSIKTVPTPYIFLTTWYVDKNVSKAFKKIIEFFIARTAGFRS